MPSRQAWARPGAPRWEPLTNGRAQKWIPTVSRPANRNRRLFRTAQVVFSFPCKKGGVPSPKRGASPRAGARVRGGMGGEGRAQPRRNRDGKHSKHLREPRRTATGTATQNRDIKGFNRLARLRRNRDGPRQAALLTYFSAPS